MAAGSHLRTARVGVSIGETTEQAEGCPMAGLMAKIRKWLGLGKKS